MFAAPVQAEGINEPPDGSAPPVPESIEEIAMAVDISPTSPEFQLLPPDARFLLENHRGCAATISDGRVVGFFGDSLGVGVDAADAEQVFWANSAGAFGVGDLDLMTTRSHEAGRPDEDGQVGGAASWAMTVFAYQQRMDGLPVEYATGRLVVENANVSVTLVSGSFVARPAEAFAPLTLTPEQAREVLLSDERFTGLILTEQAQLVVYAGTVEQWSRYGDWFGPPVRAWKLRGESEEGVGPVRAFAFFVDAATGALVAVRDEVFHMQVNGRVTARVSPVPYPDRPNNPPSDDVGLADLLITLNSAPVQTTYSDSDGYFSFSTYTGPNVNVTTNASAGRWLDIDVAPGTGGEVSDTQSSAGFVELKLNRTLTEASVAQANSLYYITQVHNFFKARNTWTGLDTNVRVAMNYPGEAGWNGGQLAFPLHDPNEPAQPNPAWSSVLAHEYGHFVVNQLGVQQGAFGEGFGDALAILFTNFSCFAPDLVPPGTVGCVREYDDSGSHAYRPYPCVDPEFHECGAVLAGLWWDIRNEFVAYYGLTDGLARVRDLFVDWAVVSNGGMGVEGAHPHLVREILVVNNNGGPPNTAPDYSRICAAALHHNLALPRLPSGCTVKTLAITKPLLSFQQPIVFHTSRAGSPCDVDGIDPFGIAVGDVNGDGNQDVVLACEGTATDSTTWKLLLFLGNPLSATMFDCPPTVIPIHASGRRPAKLAIGKLTINGDAPDTLPDIAVALQGDVANGLTGAGVQILLNTGSAPWYTSTDPTKTRFLTVTDGSTTLHRPVGIAIGDWEGDGRTDIAVAGNDGIGPLGHPLISTLFFRPGQTNPTVEFPALPTTDVGKGFDLQYWNNAASGLASHHLVMSNDGAQAFYVLRYDPADQALTDYVYVPQPPPPLGGIGGISSQGVVPADLDNDGDTDLAFSSPDALTSQMAWFRQDGADNAFVDGLDRHVGFIISTPAGIAEGRISKRFQSGTLQPDNDRDLVVAYTSNFPPSDPFIDPRIRIFVNKGTAGPPRFLAYSFTVTSNPSDRPYARQVAVFDLNGDGFDDFLCMNRGTVGMDSWEGFSVIMNQH